MLGRYDELEKSSNFRVTCILENEETVTIIFYQKDSLDKKTKNIHADTSFFGKTGSDVVQNSRNQLLACLSLGLPFQLNLGYVQIPIKKIELVNFKSKE